MVTVAISAMNRSDEIVYKALEKGPLTKRQLAAATRYSAPQINRILTRLQLNGHVRAYRLPKCKPTYYETKPHDERTTIQSTSSRL